MRMVFLSAVCLLVSCGPPVTLYTDEVFRAAAPEVVAAWKESAPWRPARTKDLPPGSGLAALEADLAQPPAPPALLVGLALSDPERQALQTNHPATRMVFFAAPGGSPGFAEVAVRRQDAWSAVAKQAADPAGAVVFYPSDVKSDEKQAFEAVWTASGGGPLVTAIGYQPDLLKGTTPVFHWAGAEMDGAILALAPTVRVHGNPGLVRAPGASGLTWTVQKTGLGDFLWQAVSDPEKKVHFLPLETVLDRR